MANNKIPLALGFDPATSANTGLEEFVLNVSDIGDICEGDYSPSPGDVLTYNADAGCWTASATPAVAAGALSALTDICTAVTSVTQYQALVWNGTAWCPSTIPTGGGGGGITSISDAGDVTITEPVADRELLAYDDATSDWINQTTTELGIMQVDPYFTADDEGKTAVWDGSQLTVEYPDRLFIRVEAGEALAKGDLVYVSEAGPNNNTVRVMKAQADSSATMPAIGMVFSGLALDQVGTVISFGKSSPVNVGTVAIGTTVYVDPDTPGAFTTTKPTTTATDLIQNIGFVAASGSSGVVKLTGVGRSNDIPNNLDVVGSVTVGDTVISQTDAKLANVGADHILISTAASATSSITSATLFGNYYTKSQADGQFLEETTNLTGIADVTGTPGANYILQRNSGDNNWDPVTMNAALLATGERVEDHNIESLANVTNGEGYTDGDVLVYQSGDTNFTPFASSIFVTQGDSIDHGVLQGLGDDDHPQYVLATGTRTVTGTLSVKQDNPALDTLYLETDDNTSDAAPVIMMQRLSDSPSAGDYLGQIKFNGENSNSVNQLFAKITGKTSDVSAGTEDGLIEIAVKRAGSNTITTRFTGDALKLINGNGLEVDGTLDVTGATTLATGSVTATPTTANHIANKSYVDSQIPTPSYFLAFVSGGYSPIADETARDIGWSLTGAGAISDPAGNVSISDTSSSVVDIAANGVYQIDCSVQVSGPNGRTGLELDVYINTAGDGFVVSSQYQTANYTTRGVGSGENIERGTCHMNTMMSLNNGDSLQFWFNPRLGGTSIMPADGTYLRIIKIA